MRTSQVISQASIAMHLNLSQRTVSLCLAGSDRVADKTRRRVLAVAQDLGYRPNRSALSMRSGRFNAVALLQSTHPDYSFLPQRLLTGIQDGLLRSKMHLVLANVPDEKLVEDGYLPSVFREWSVDGVLVNYNYGFSPRMVQAIESSRLPTIWLNSKRPSNCVYPDDVGAGRKLTEAMLRAGHQRVAFFSHRRFEDHFSVADRYNGYDQAMRSAGLQPQKLFFPDIHWDEATEGLGYVRSFLEAPDRPTAVVAYESFEASRVLLMAFKLGLDIPRELSLGTFNEREYNGGGFPVSTLEIPEVALGLRALELLQQRIADTTQELPSEALTFVTLSGSSIISPES